MNGLQVCHKNLNLQHFGAAADPELVTSGYEQPYSGLFRGQPKMSGTCLYVPRRQKHNDHHWALMTELQHAGQSQGEALPPGQPHQELNMDPRLSNVDKWSMELLEEFMLRVAKEHGA